MVSLQKMYDALQSIYGVSKMYGALQSVYGVSKMYGALQSVYGALQSVYGALQSVYDVSKILNNIPSKGPSTKIVMTPTVDARVAGFEVGHQVLGTRLLMMKYRIGQCDDAAGTTRAATVEERKDVGGAADVEVRVDAAADAHATVMS